MRRCGEVEAEGRTGRGAGGAGRGLARGHVDGVAVPVQVATQTCGPITFEMPATEPGEAIVTVSSARPEELFATAFVYVAA